MSKIKFKVGDYTMKTIIDEVKRLNNDINNTITELVKARLAHNDAAVANIHHKMESLMVETQQVCSFIIDNLPNENLDEAADCYLENIQPVGFMEGDYDGSQILDTFRAGANWQKEQIINKACEWLKRCVDVDDEVKMIDGEPEVKSFIQKACHRVEVTNQVIEDFKKAMEDND